MLRTALVEAEGILSSRPITHVLSDAGDIEALTPNHYLLLRANPSYEDADVSDREINSTNFWRQSQALANFFWRHFTKEYLPSLTERKKWKEKKLNLKRGMWCWLQNRISREECGHWEGSGLLILGEMEKLERSRFVLSAGSTKDQLQICVCWRKRKAEL